MIKGILFDFDGTLINTNNLIVKSFKYTFKKHLNLDVEEKEIVRYFGEPLKTTLGRYGGNLDSMLATYFSYNEENHDNLVESFNGVDEGLSAIKSLGLKTAIVTSKRKVIVEKGLNIIKINRYLDAMVTLEDTTEHKPNGAPCLKACELLGLKPQETIMVGDSYYDILCGKNAGCKTCVVNYSALSKDELEKYSPDYYIDEIKDLVDLIKISA